MAPQSLDFTTCERIGVREGSAVMQAEREREREDGGSALSVCCMMVLEVFFLFVFFYSHTLCSAAVTLLDVRVIVCFFFVFLKQTEYLSHVCHS